VSHIEHGDVNLTPETRLMQGYAGHDDYDISSFLVFSRLGDHLECIP